VTPEGVLLRKSRGPVSNIVIKELFPSDPLSEAVEKINYNFDQLMLAGGGPPGIQGGTGPTGPHGPIGTRGSLWFAGTTGITATYTGDVLRDGDQLLISNGDVFDWSTDLAGWTYSGINLLGPTGGSGATGSSYEWQFFYGFTGNAADPLAYGPTTGNPSSVQSSNVDFVIPVSPNKNSIFVGDRQWYYDRLSNFNVVPDGSGSTGTFQGDVPKLTLIQREVNYAGLNGLAFGAVGLTSNASSIPSIGDLTAPVNGLDFVNFGFVREATLPEYHSFLVNSFKMPIRIQVGGDTSNYGKARITINSFESTQSSYDGSRVIASGQTAMAWASGADQSFIEIFAKHSQYSLAGGITGGSAGYVSIQGMPGSVTDSGADHSYGFTIIGPTYSNIGLYRGFVSSHPSALIVSRTINNYNTDSSIKFFSPGNLSSVNDFVAKMVALAGPEGKTFQISGRRVSINPVFSTNSVQLVPKFPFHVLQSYNNLQGPGFTGAYQHAYVDKWIAGFDSYNSSDGVYTSTGLGIGYTIPGIPFSGNKRDPLIQTYYTGTAIAVNTPPLTMQLGYEDSDGNLMLGLAPVPGVYLGKSKLNVFGSVNIGPTSYMQITSAKGPTFGLRVRGSVLQGVESYAPSTISLSSLFYNDQLGERYGIYSNGRIIGRSFIATHNGDTNYSSSTPAFSVGDLYSGIRGMTYGGEMRAMAKFSSSTAVDVMRFSTVGEDANLTFTPGVQILTRSAAKPLYFDAGDLADSIKGIPSPTASGLYAVATIPTSNAVVILDGNGFHNDSVHGYGTWKWIGGLNSGMTAGQIASTYFMVELEPGYYDGQEVEIVSNAWGVNGLSPSYNQPAFSLRNNARWMYTGQTAKLVLGKEFNGGGNVDAISDYGTDGPTTPGYGLPYPFPHGALQAGPALGADSVDNSKWSAQGQFTVFGYKSIRLRWMRICPINNIFNPNPWRWVEIARSARSVDDTLINGAFTGDTGNSSD